MCKNLLIKGGRVIDPANGVDKVCDVLISGDKFAGVGEVEAPDGCEVIDAEGKLVVPGLIDIHVHFREPGDEEEETIASGSAAAVRGGFTSVVCMPNTKPTIQRETDIEYVHRKGRQARKSHVYVMGAVTKEREGVELAEMGLMREAGAVGFTDDGNGIQSPSVMRRALKYSSMFDAVICQHCEAEGFAGRGVMNSGYYSTILGMPGMDSLAEEAILWRDIAILKKMGNVRVKYHAQHISTRGGVELIRGAKGEGLDLSCEVTPHHLLLTEECCKDYDTNYKVNPPLRTQEDIEALKEGIAEGVIDVLASDHAPHLQSEKELEFMAAPCGIASLECALSLYVKALIDGGVIGWSELIRMMTINPAKVIGIDKGAMTVGKQGDLTIINADHKYDIDVKSFVSKSRNCPYDGWSVRARVEKTIVGGEIRYSV